MPISIASSRMVGPGGLRQPRGAASHSPLGAAVPGAARPPHAARRQPAPPPRGRAAAAQSPAGRSPGSSIPALSLRRRPSLEETPRPVGCAERGAAARLPRRRRPRGRCPAPGAVSPGAGPGILGVSPPLPGRSPGRAVPGRVPGAPRCRGGALAALLLPRLMSRTPLAAGTLSRCHQRRGCPAAQLGWLCATGGSSGNAALPDRWSSKTPGGGGEREDTPRHR